MSFILEGVGMGSCGDDQLLSLPPAALAPPTLLVVHPSSGSVLVPSFKIGVRINRLIGGGGRGCSPPLREVGLGGIRMVKLQNWGRGRATGGRRSAVVCIRHGHFAREIVFVEERGHGKERGKMRGDCES